MIREQETVSMLSRLSWGVITQHHCAGQVKWIKKQRTQRHPFGWEVRVMVWLAGGSKDIVMGVSKIGGGGGYLWVCGNLGVLSQIKGMVYGAQGVGTEACFYFTFGLLRFEPREAGETPGSSTSPMPPTTRREATSSGTDEQELEPLLHFT